MRLVIKSEAEHHPVFLGSGEQDYCVTSIKGELKWKITLIIPMHKTTFYNNIKPKRGKCVTSLQYSDVRPSYGNTFIPCIVLVKDGNSSLFFGKKGQQIQIYSLTHL